MKFSPTALLKILPLAFSLLAPVLLAGCGGAARETSASRNAAGSNAANAQTAASTPEETLPKIVAFGDSLTAGYGLAQNESYPSLLQKMVDADGFKYEVVNAGVSGDTSAGGVRRVDWTMDSGNVRFVVLELGANDFLRGQPVAETKKNLADIIERCKSRGAQVLLAGMYTTTDAGRDYEQQIQNVFQSLAKEHDGVVLIPFFLEGVAGRDELNQQDRIHPNAEGTKIVAANVYRYLKPLLEKEQGRREK
ncbi:MAG TPA: arylesterase [Pyrinomonadaceae bacterium]|nr:arylesterase [Pyrinomonadaceae bacterium]